MRRTPRVEMPCMSSVEASTMFSVFCKNNEEDVPTRIGDAANGVSSTIGRATSYQRAW